MSHYPESPEEIKAEFSEKAVEETEEVSISVIHRKYNDNLEVQSVEKFDLENDESEGTKKFLGIMGPVLNTIDNGSILIIDEFDARFHPFVTQLIIQLFHSGEINSKNAQLIFATHDTNLLSRELFRKDQIWFVEKDEYGATDLYSLVEYKHLKKNTRWCCRNGDIQIFYSCNISMMSIIMSPLLQHYQIPYLMRMIIY